MGFEQSSLRNFALQVLMCMIAVEDTRNMSYSLHYSTRKQIARMEDVVVEWKEGMAETRDVMSERR